MTDRELLQQALDVLEDVFEVNDWTTYNKTIEALRTRLAQPELEPVAWIKKDRSSIEVSIMSAEYMRNAGFEPLYTAPPKKEWVGLTDDDVGYFVDAIYKGFDMKPKNEVEIAYFERLIKFVGAKLEDKNT